MSFAGTYWVSTTGAASWASAESATPLSGTACTTLTTAASNAVAGDIVNIRAGTYSSDLQPSNSGSSGSRITFQAYNSEVVTLSNTTIAIYLNGKSYITIKDIISTTPSQRLLLINNGSSYNEFDSCQFIGVGSVDTVKMWDGQTTGGTACTNNWFHGCTFGDTGYLFYSTEVDDGGGMQIGVPSYDNHSNNNTIENCTFYAGGHHNLETYTKYNVIRNNFFHHEGAFDNNTGETAAYGPDTNSKWGNRNIQIYDGYSEDKYNLLEGNRFGTSGPPPDDDGGDSLTITAPHNIIRYNFIYNSLNNGVLFKLGASSSSDNNRFYNNTIYKSGRYQNTGPLWQGSLLRWYKSGSTYPVDNIIKNNLFYSYGGVNEIYEQAGGAAVNTLTNNHWTADGAPGFANTDVSDPTSATLPDFTITPTSPAYDAGASLTTTTGSGSSSTTLVVADSQYFQDGSWGSSLSSIEADWVAVGTINNTAQISSISYSTDTITLSSALTWSSSDPVWLYKDSSGNVKIKGTSPDIGAYEAEAGSSIIVTTFNASP